MYIYILYMYLCLQDGGSRIFQWFLEKQMKENADKYHL